MLLKSLASTGGGNVGRLDIWLLLRVLMAVAAFAVLLNPLGLVLTAVIVVMLAASAGHEFRFGEALANATVLALLLLPAVRLGAQPAHAGLASVPRRAERGRAMAAGISSATSRSVLRPP